MVTKSKRMAECHPDKAHVAKGLCQNCYNKLPKSRERGRKFNQTEKGKLRRKRHRLTETFKNTTLKYNYGISLDDYNRLMDSQKALCALCHEPLDLKCQPRAGLAPVVDHDHITNKVRGILHSRCNSKLGLFSDSIEELLSAIKYLELHL